MNSWHRAPIGSSFSSLGGILTADPAAVSWGTNRVDVFVRGQDESLFHLDWDANRWSGWSTLGGVLATGPGAA